MSYFARIINKYCCCCCSCSAFLFQLNSTTFAPLNMFPAQTESFLWTSRSLPSPIQKSPASLCDFHCKKGLEVTVFVAFRNPRGRRLTPRKIQTLDCHSNFLMHLIKSFISTSFNITDWNLFGQFKGRAFDPQLSTALESLAFQSISIFTHFQEIPYLWWKVLSLLFYHCTTAISDFLLSSKRAIPEEFPDKDTTC